MRRLLSEPGRSCLLGKLWRFTQNLWQDKSNIFHFSERSRSWFLERGGRGWGTDRPGAENLNLIRNTLKYIVTCYKPWTQGISTNIPLNLVHFIFYFSQFVFVPGPRVPPGSAASVQTTHPLTSSHLMWLLTPGPGAGEQGAQPLVSVWVWPGRVCHDVMASWPSLPLSSRPMECRSNSWTASCQCPQWAHQAGASAPVTVGHSGSGSGLEFMAVTHCQQWQHPVFIAATRHQPQPRDPGTHHHHHHSDRISN